MADKRKKIREEIEAGEARHAAREQTLSERIGERAIEAKDSFTHFAREHPVATVAGGIAIGALVSLAFSGPRKAAGRAAGKAGTQASALAAIVGKLAVDYAGQALHAANEARRTGADRFEDLADSAGSTARGLRRSASHRAHDAGDAARLAAREARRAISKAIRRAG